ncbi:MAG: SCO family protein [Gallionella sp.]
MTQKISSGATPRDSANRFRRAMPTILLMLACAAPFAALGLPLNLYSVPDSLVNDRNETVHLSDWRGKPLILTMEHSNCRFSCSVTFSKLKSIQTLADQKNIKIDFMIISVDPRNDTPAAWRQYRKSRDVERNNWHLLTGSEAATKVIANLLGIKYWYMDEHVFHDFKILRLNAQGQVVKEITDYSDEPGPMLQ